jgi:hypothetical protein
MRSAWQRLGAPERRMAAEVFLGVAAVLAVLARVEGIDGLLVAALGMLVASGLLIVVQAPIGSVPLGYALVIAIAGLASTATYFEALALGLLVTLPVFVVRYGPEDSVRRVVRWLVAGCACGAAAAAMRPLTPEGSADFLLLSVTISGAVFLSVDLVARAVLPTPTSPPVNVRQAWPVYVSLLCAAGLLAVAYHKDQWMAIVALVPLVMTRFAFDRYAAAQQAYRQTIKALSIVPEVAGVTPLGHGERSAVYAVALARRLGLADEAVERVATAARLHHIGYVAVDNPQEASTREDQVRLAARGAEILRQTEFLADVGDLVESVHAPDVTTREAAVVRIATAFDHLVLEDPGRALGALQLLRFQQNDAYGSAAALVLHQVLDEDPAVVDRAIASGAPLTEAATASRARRV